MSKISDLPDPTTIQFQHWGSVSPSRLLIGRTFLAGAYYTSPKNEEERQKRAYGQELFIEIGQNEIPFDELIVTWHTLSTAIAHLDGKRSDSRAVKECLDRFLNSERFSIHYPEPSIYQKSIDKYQEFEDERPNLHEIADYLHMCEIGVNHYVTWDSDFTAFGDITLLPHKYWRS